MTAKPVRMIEFVDLFLYFRQEDKKYSKQLLRKLKKDILKNFEILSMNVVKKKKFMDFVEAFEVEHQIKDI